LLLAAVVITHRGYVKELYKRYQPAVAYHASRLTALQGPTVPTACWEARRTFLAATAAAWSPAATVAAAGSSGSSDGHQQQQQKQRVTLLAVGCKAGCCQLWRHQLPQQCSTSTGDDSSSDGGSSDMAAAEYLGSVPVARGAYVTSLAWAALPATAEGCSSSSGGGKGWGVVPGYVVQQEAGDAMVLAVGKWPRPRQGTIAVPFA
jgi:hypothetical protein